MANRLNILALETSTSACSVALIQVIAERETITHLDHRIAPKQHTQILLPMIEALLAKAGLGLSDLQGIAVGIGPGSFTGCRLAVSTAKGLAMLHHIPLLPVSSLAALCQTAYAKTGEKNFLVSIDAKTQQVYFAGYELNAEGRMVCVIPEQCLAIDSVQVPTDEKWVGVGDGWAAFPPPSRLFQAIYPEATAVAELALVNLRSGVWVSPDALSPDYGRDYR